MSILFENYKFGHRIVSIAFDEIVKDDLHNNGLDVIFVTGDWVKLFPENEVISYDASIIDKLHCYSDYDVFELWPNGYMKRVYNTKSEDNVFFISGRCNSNCIMCPSPEHTRKGVEDSDIDMLIDIAKHIPSDAPHITITGGEPFIVGKKIFELIKFSKEKFCNTDFLILTNGRVFAVQEYVDLLVENIPSNCMLGIPLHGSNEDVHDGITRTKGSFKQTVLGIKHLLRNNIRVELRIVISRENAADLLNVAKLILREMPVVHHISIIAMEMTGNANVNLNDLWLPYSEAFKAAEKAVLLLLKNAIDVKLFNFPLCTVAHPYWTLCENSITKEKIRYADFCKKCIQRNACGGVFAGTIRLEEKDLKVII